MKYNPKIHNRRSIRLQGYDYSHAGAYFITCCCHDRKCWFGKIENDDMILNEYGMVAYNEWIKLTERFSNFELDVFQIMPNHIHVILVLNDVGASLADAQMDLQANRATARVAPTTETKSKTVGDIIGAYKSLVANECLEIFKLKYVGAGLAPAQIPMMGKLWQRNFYDHIIRNEKSYQTISNYIINNPANWKDDKFYQE
jgi:REP element-mobilizing transposase RayT